MSAPLTAQLDPTLVLDTPHAPDGLGGLLALVNGVQRALPLDGVKVRASVAGTCCRTVVEQRFRNDHDVPIEAVHLFPLPPDAAVIEAELRAGDLVVRAECRERVEAEQRFEQARAAGHRAALLTAERDDVHTLRVTNLPPKESVTVRLVLVEALAVVDGQVRWRFPTVVAPRYLPGEEVGHRGDGVLPDTDRVPDASRLQPPLRLQGGTTLDLEVELAGPVRRLSSSLHAVRLDLEDGLVRVAPSGRATCDRDFVLAFSTGEDQATAVRAWTDGTHTLVLVEPPMLALAPPLPRDAVFVVDISGSMGGEKMRAAQSALKSALHGLLPGDRFRLIAFDDRLEHFRPDLVPYDDRSLQAADRWIDGLSARGGTEMLPAIQAALSGDTPAERLRTVLFITDGQAWNEQELVAAVANRRKGACFFTLGIDTAVNASLLQRLARVGGGVCELAAPGDDIEATVVRLETRFGAPLVTQLLLEGQIAARPEAGVLYSGRPATLLCEGAPGTVAVTGLTREGAWRAEAAPAKVDFPLGALWARERIASLEDRLTLRPYEEEALRPEILRIALAHHLASRFTAFIAVEETRVVQGERLTVVQSAELPAGWDPSFVQPPVSRPAPPSAPMPRPAAMPPMAGGPVGAPAPSTGFPMGGPVDAMSVSDGPADFKQRDKASKGAVRKKTATRGGGGLFDGLASLFGRSSGKTPPAEEEVEANRERSATVRSPSPVPAEKEVADERARRDEDPAATLARTQGADGSYGGDVGRTAAALVALVLLGHTRRAGLRRRTVLKAATWLATRTGDPIALLAIGILEAAERGEQVSSDDGWAPLLAAGAEGAMLADLV